MPADMMEQARARIAGHLCWICGDPNPTEEGIAPDSEAPVKVCKACWDWDHNE